MPTNTFFKALRQKDIKINNHRIGKDCIICAGDEILLYIADNLLTPCFDLNIVYEDENILIIDKPINIEVTGNESLTSIVHSKFLILVLNLCLAIDLIEILLVWSYLPKISLL